MLAKKVFLSLAALSFLYGAISQPAQCRSTKTVKHKATAAPQTEEAMVRALLVSLKNCVGTADAITMAQLWTEDGRYIDETGQQYKGRVALEKNFTAIFKENGKSQVTIVGESIHFPATTVALVEGTVNRTEGNQLVPVTRYSMVMEKKNGKWLISSATETPITEHAAAANPLQNLEWLVGDWHAEKDGTSVKMQADWVPSHNFICCKYIIKKGNENPQIEMQVIGWDPLRQKPLSWNFDSSGGFGQGSWSHKNNQWYVDSSAVEQNGSITNSTNIYTNADKNSFSWQSVNRRVNGLSIADLAPLKVQRLIK